MLKIVFFPVTLLALCLCIWSQSTYESKTGEIVHFVGSIDGKSYYAVTNTTADIYKEANESCHAMGMRLAEVASRAQADLIASYYEAGQIPGGDYWIGARDAWELKQFSWNSTNSDLSGSGYNVTTYHAIPLGCLKFNMQQKGYIYQITFLVGHNHLCEITNSYVKPSEKYALKALQKY